MYVFIFLSLHQKRYWFWKYNLWLQPRGLTGYIWFSLHWSFTFLEDSLYFFFLCVTWAYLGIQKFVLQYGKKGSHSFLWWNCQQIPCWIETQRCASRVCRVRQLPFLHLLTWLETGSYSFHFLNSLLTEKCSFEWTKVIYKAQLSAANSVG